MPNINDLETFLNDKTCKDDDIVEIMNGGVIIPKEDVETKKKYSVLQMLVRCNGKELTWQPNNDAVKVLSEKYGADSDKWVGVKFQAKIYPKTAFGVTRNAILPKLLQAK